MSMRIITGSTGTTHVTSNDDGCYNQAVWGNDSIVLNTGEKLAATVIDNNTIQVKDGDLLLQGRHARINPSTIENVSITTGSVGTNRNDLIVARYTLDDTTGYESIVLKVIEGTETEGAAEDPEYTEGNIRTGSILVDYPLYRVKIEGINIIGIDKLFTVIDANVADIVDAKNDITEIKENLTQKVGFYNGETIINPFSSQPTTWGAYDVSWVATCNCMMSAIGISKSSDLRVYINGVDVIDLNNPNTTEVMWTSVSIPIKKNQTVRVKLSNGYVHNIKAIPID